MPAHKHNDYEALQCGCSAHGAECLQSAVRAAEPARAADKPNRRREGGDAA